MAKKITGASPTAESDGPRWSQKSFAASIPPYIRLTPAQMEDRYGLSKSFWLNHRKENTGPPFDPMGARTILYPLGGVEAWFAELEVYGFDDPKYKEIVAARKAKTAMRAKAKKTSAKAPKARAMPLIPTFSQVRLGQLRLGDPASGITRFDGYAKPGSKSGPQTATRVAQSVIATLCPRSSFNTSKSSYFLKKEVRLPA